MDKIQFSQMKLSQLRALVAVAEYCNFSEAALNLELSQSAVSHAIASLEAELGVQLFARGRHGATLTPVGERVTTHARQVLQLLEGIVQEAYLERSLSGGHLRVAAFRSVATHVLSPVIAQFHSRFPETVVSLTEQASYLEVEQSLREGRTDIGFTHLPTSEEFETWEIVRDEYVALMPPATQLNSADLTWEKLATYPLILPEASVCYARLYKHLSSSGFSFNIAYRVSEDSTIVSMVFQGLGIGILPRLAAEPIPKGINLYRLPTPFERVIGAAVVANRLHTPAVFQFLAALREPGPAISNAEQGYQPLR